MESLGGDNAWVDRFIAQHSAIIYFWALIVFYAFSPKDAYAFSELVEGHASDTYEGACHTVHTMSDLNEIFTGQFDSKMM